MFKLFSNYKPAGDQPQAIEKLSLLAKGNQKFLTLIGATGTGKTFTMANVIEHINKPVLVISHNKTLAYQLYNEFKVFFPKNAVEYFVSYYDYYQPEAYIPSTDTYIEKESSINEMIDRLRLRATSSLISRSDVLVVSTVSCIYGLGSPELYSKFMLLFEKGSVIDLKSVFKKLVDMQYERKTSGYERSTFVVKGDIVDIFPAYEEIGIRIELWDDEIRELKIFTPLTGEIIERVDKFPLFPAKHFMAERSDIGNVLENIEGELNDRLVQLKVQNKLLEAQRLESRTRYDMEMIREIGYCNGIENYSRFFDGRASGMPPATLIDFFPKDYLLIIDESHVTVPQIGGMYAGDRSRKETLVEYGFRLPAALDNRPLNFAEFEGRINQCVFVSATPSDYELKKSGNNIVEQINRPTGIPDPIIEVRPTKGQIDDLISEVKKVVATNDRVIVITLTKKMAEDLAEFMDEMGVRARYLHSELTQNERSKNIEDLKDGDYDVVIGINLLREGIDLPVVSLVVILDADKEGFLRSEKSLIQIVGRASRNEKGKVIFYADKITNSMKRAMDETRRRREIQLEFNKVNNVTPFTVAAKKYEAIGVQQHKTVKENVEYEKNYEKQTNEIYFSSEGDKEKLVLQYEKEMKKAAKELDFEEAARLRDLIVKLGGKN